MRVLWTSFLLIGSITCAPQGSYRSSDPSKPTHEKPTEQASGSGTYRSPGFYYSSGTNTAGGASSSASGPALYYSGSTGATGGAGSSGYGQHGGQSQSGAPSSQHQITEESWTSSDGEEPVFTPVTDEDQVYAHKSRSRYNKDRFVFSQFHYTKTDPLQPQEPVFPYPGKTWQNGKGSF